MSIFGIKFVPLSEPLHNRLLALIAGSVFITLSIGMPSSFILAFCLIFFTRYWWLTLIYLYFCYSERAVCKNGGRPSEWVRNWTVWKWFAEYFPIKVHKAGRQDFDPHKNYLLICYPHGLLPMGIVTAMGTTATNWQRLFPHHEARCSTMNLQYYTPFYRELMLGIGGMSCDASTITQMLGKPGGGHCVALTPGGADEAFYSNPGKYKIVLKKRKGFVKLALKMGVSLVPIFTFGEAHLFRQSTNKYLQAVLSKIKKIIGILLIFPIGRGLFQYSFGFIPLQRPLDVVVGDPIEVKKSENPTQEEIDELHQKFIDAILNLFEQEKHKYIENAENVKLELAK